jgi:hypothetical protein
MEAAVVIDLDLAKSVFGGFFLRKAIVDVQALNLANCGGQT